MALVTLPHLLSNHRRWRSVAGGFAIAFGVATLLEGGHVLFGGPAARAEAGNFVPFVLWFNFAAGFAYVAAGAATLLERRSAVWLARVIAGSTALVFMAFGVHVALGGAFESRTVVAMTLRTAFWVAQALVLRKLLGPAPASSAASRQGPPHHDH
jgi:hypothetical protein